MCLQQDLNVRKHNGGFFMRRCLVIMAIFALGCEGSSTGPGVTCPSIALPAITIIPIDASSGETVRSLGTATATEGSYVDTAQNGPPALTNFALAYERPGTYKLAVEIPGYVRWELSKVVVASGVCGVSTIPIAAQLNRK